MAEAKANLSYREAVNWFAFISQRGGLFHEERLLATIAAQINRLAGGELEVGDFLPKMKTVNKREQVASIGEVMGIIGSTL